MKFKHILLTISCTLIAVACTEPDYGPANGYTRVAFSLDESYFQISGSTDYTFIGVNTSAESPEYFYPGIMDNGMYIDLPKEGIYLIGAFEAGSVRLVPNERSISSALQNIGNIQIVSAGLDSLPLSDSGSSDLNLGPLNYNPASAAFTSAISEADMQTGSGYDSELLSSFGMFDKTLKKFLNPDINRNGVIDADENLDWSFFSEYLFTVNPDFFKITTTGDNFEPSSLFSPTRKLLYFDPVSGFGILPEDLDEIQIVFPEELEVINDNNEAIKYKAARLVQSDNSIIQFDLTTIVSPPAFFSGNYMLRIGES